MKYLSWLLADTSASSKCTPSRVEGRKNCGLASDGEWCVGGTRTVAGRAQAPYVSACESCVSAASVANLLKLIINST